MMSEQQRDTISDIRVVVFGEEATGKSSTGNALLGRNEFQCKYSTEGISLSIGVAEGRNITVVDTPGWVPKCSPNDPLDILKSACDSTSLNGQGFDVVLLVIPIWQNQEWNQRFAQRLLVALRWFDDNFWRHTMVLFTRANLLDHTGLDGYLQDSGQPMQNLLMKCGHRCHALNNFTLNGSKELSKLFQKIEQMVKENDGRTLQLVTNGYEEDTLTNDKLQEMEEKCFRIEKQIYTHKSIRSDEQYTTFEQNKHSKVKTLWDFLSQGEMNRVYMQEAIPEHLYQVSQEDRFHEKFVRKSYEDVPEVKQFAIQTLQILRYACAEHQLEPSEGSRKDIQALICFLMWLISNDQCLIEESIKYSKTVYDDGPHNEMDDFSHQSKRISAEEVHHHTTVENKKEKLKQNIQAENEKMPKKNRMEADVVTLQHSRNKGKEEIPTENQDQPQNKCDDKESKRRNAEEIFHSNKMEDKEKIVNSDETLTHNKPGRRKKIPKENRTVADSKTHQYCKEGDEEMLQNKKWDNDEEIPKQSKRVNIEKTRHNRTRVEDKIPELRKKKNEATPQRKQSKDDKKMHQHGKRGNQDIPQDIRQENKEVPQKSKMVYANQVLQSKGKGAAGKIPPQCKVKDEEEEVTLKRHWRNEVVVDSKKHLQSLKRDQCVSQNRNDDELPQQTKRVDAELKLNTNRKEAAEKIPQHLRVANSEETLTHNVPGKHKVIPKKNRIGADSKTHQHSKEGDQETLQNKKWDNDEEIPKQSKRVNIEETRHNRTRVEDKIPELRKKKNEATPQRKQSKDDKKMHQHGKRGNQDIPQDIRQENKEVPQKSKMVYANQVLQSKGKGAAGKIPPQCKVKDEQETLTHKRLGENKVVIDFKKHLQSLKRDQYLLKNKYWNDDELPQKSKSVDAEFQLHTDRKEVAEKIPQHFNGENDEKTLNHNMEEEKEDIPQPVKKKEHLPKHGDGKEINPLYRRGEHKKIPQHNKRDDEEPPLQSRRVYVEEMLHSIGKGSAEEIPQQIMVENEEETIGFKRQEQRGEKPQVNKMDGGEMLLQHSKKKKKENLPKHGNEQEMSSLHRLEGHIKIPQNNEGDKAIPRQSNKGKEMPQPKKNKAVKNKPPHNRNGEDAKTNRNSKQDNQDQPQPSRQRDEVIPKDIWRGGCEDILQKTQKDYKGLRPQSKRQENKEIPYQTRRGNRKNAPQPNGRGNRGDTRAQKKEVVAVIKKRPYKQFRGTKEGVQKALSEEPAVEQIPEARISALQEQSHEGAQHQILPLLEPEAAGFGGNKMLILSRVEFGGSSSIKKTQSMDLDIKLRSAGTEDWSRDGGYRKTRRSKSLEKFLTFWQ